MRKITESADEVDGITARWAATDAPDGVALWLTHLGGSAEQTQPMLTQLADRGLLAVSFDPPGHGRRSDGRDPLELGREVLGAFRRRMWPLAERTVLESLRVFDWAGQQFGTAGRRVVGGVSLGGDIAVALPASTSASRASQRSSPPLTGRAPACGCSATSRSSSTRVRQTATRSGSTTLSIRSPISTPIAAIWRSASCAGRAICTCPRGRPSFSGHAGRARVGRAVRRPRPPRHRPRRAAVHRRARVADALISGGRRGGASPYGGDARRASADAQMFTTLSGVLLWNATVILTYAPIDLSP